MPPKLKGYLHLKRKLKDAEKGRSYWKTLALKLEKDLIRQPMMNDLIRERDQLLKRCEVLDTVRGDIHLSLMWFHECKKAYADAKGWEDKYRELKGKINDSRSS